MASESESDDNSDPPVRHVYVKSDAGIFSFDGYQLEFQDHPYATNVAQYIPLLEPTRTKRGTIAARQPRHDSQPDAWWEAQCVFRGLGSDGAIADLQNRLRGHEEDPITEHIRDLLERARKKFKAKNAEAKEANWMYKMSDEEKATADPKRYLQEKFPIGLGSKETELLTTHFVVNIQETAEELGLCCEYTHASTDGDAVLQMAKYWVVVGQDKSTVTQRVRMIERMSERLKREQQEGQQELRRKNKESKRTKQMETDGAVAKSKDWDVTGLWNISCPHIEEGWDAENLTLRIYWERTTKGPQMFAEFDFGAITGVCRFERQKGDARIAPSGEASNNDDDNDADDEDENDEGDGNDERSIESSDGYGENDEENDDNDDEDDDEDEYQQSPTPESFYFGSTSQPSAKHPTWQYRYRGEETGEGVLELGSDNDLYSITFGPKGRTLNGTFGGSAFGVCTFTGVKVGIGGTDDLDIRQEWANRNWSAYENARAGRWH